MLKVVDAFLWGDLFYSFPDRVDESFPRPGRIGSEARFDFRPHLFDWVEIGRVWRQIPDLRPDSLDHFHDAFNLVAGKVIHHHDVAILKNGN